MAKKKKKKAKFSKDKPQTPTFQYMREEVADELHTASVNLSLAMKNVLTGHHFRHYTQNVITILKKLEDDKVLNLKQRKSSVSFPDPSMGF